MTTVSVIIPTYSRTASLCRAIDSVLAQTYRDWELIVVDDGCPTDSISKVVSGYVARDPRIRYVQQPNGGSYRARNAGIAQATGTYIAFLDDDDEWTSEKLKTQVSLMESHPEVGLCYTFFQVYRECDGKLEATRQFPCFPATKFEELMETFLAPNSVMMRKACLDQIAWFDPQFPISADFDLWLRFVQRWQIRAIDQVGTVTVMDSREHEGGNELAARRDGIRVLRNLKLRPECKHYKRLVMGQIARRYYLIGRIYLDQQNFGQAAKHFALAVLTDPLVGLTVRGPEEKGPKLFLRIFKSYAAIPACALKGLMYAKR